MSPSPGCPILWCLCGVSRVALSHDVHGVSPFPGFPVPRVSPGRCCPIVSSGCLHPMGAPLHGVTRVSSGCPSPRVSPSPRCPISCCLCGVSRVSLSCRVPIPWVPCPVVSPGCPHSIGVPFHGITMVSLSHGVPGVSPSPSHECPIPWCHQGVLKVFQSHGVPIPWVPHPMVPQNVPAVAPTDGTLSLQRSPR